ncbi:MAG: tetratricopeptide repeat protein [Agriterribacter sp.]
MNSLYRSSIRFVKKCFFTLLFLLFINTGFSQKPKADSLSQLLNSEKTDTGKVKLMWQLADVTSGYHPDTALQMAQKALFLAKKIKYTEGESRSLGIIAEVFRKIGNYPRALEFNFKKLQLEENRNNAYNLASALNNIGIVYVFQEEYHKALEYYYAADSAITLNNIQPFKYNIALNLGDVYNRLNISDSAYHYFDKSLKIAEQLKDGDFIGTSMTGLAHSYVKQKNYDLALVNYHAALAYLAAANDDDIYCEASLGLASLYKKINKHDSAIYYANRSLATAKKDGFLSHELEAAELLTDFYMQEKNMDSAFLYIGYVKALNDSINSKDKIRELQIISSNEQLRQAEIEENKRIAMKERSQQLQLLSIGIFIPLFFLLTMLLSRIKMHARVIKVLGIISLLVFFEYLTLLLHPYVEEITHHTPLLEILIFVSIAAILIPTHHRIEHWLIEKLIHKREENEAARIKFKSIKLKMKTPS